MPAGGEQNGDNRVRKLIVLMLPALFITAFSAEAFAQTAAPRKQSQTKASAKHAARAPKPVAPQQDQSYFDAGPVGSVGSRQDYLGIGANSGSIPFRGSMVGGSAGAFPGSFGLDPNPAMR